MKIIKSEILKALEIVKPGLGSKEIVEQSTSFVFMDNRVITHNDDISISHPVPNLKLRGAIKADEVYKLLGKMKKEEMDLELIDNELILKSGKAKAGFTLQTDIVLPLGDIEKSSNWLDLPDHFNDLLFRCAGICSKDMSKPKLTTVLVHEDGYMVGSDGFRIIRAKLPLEDIPTFLLPATSAFEVVKLNPIKISVETSWVHFENANNTVISCRLFNEDAYPPVAALFKVTGTKVIFPESIVQILDRAAIMGKQENFIDEIVEITLEENRMKIYSKSTAGWFEESAKIRYAAEPIMFNITPFVFKSILNETSTAIIGKNSMKFTGDMWEYVGMLRAV